jgi:ribonuclease E
MSSAIVRMDHHPSEVRKETSPDLNRILINADQPEEIRVALIEGTKLVNLDIEYQNHSQTKSNIYKGRISRIEPSLEAVFVDYGVQRHGFLPFKEITPSYLNSKNNFTSIKQSLRVGQEVMIQVEKEELGNKGAALTTYITLPGSYLVLMPNDPSAGGISRRIEGEDRRELYELLEQITVPESMGIILRTACVGRELSELQGDLNFLLKQWDAIYKSFQESCEPCLIFQEGDIVIRTIRDYLRGDVSEVLIDNQIIFEKAKQYITQVRPDCINQIKRYQDPIPLFARFEIESSVEALFHRVIELASGGTIVIDRTEALISIDINSGRSTKNDDIERTALETNLEAADVIMDQLRLRNLGGLIVVDCIDMMSDEYKREVENRFREAAKKDRARIQIERISRFGLLTISRQRLRRPLAVASETSCSHCDGQGTIRSVESLGLSIVRFIELEALKRQSNTLKVEVPVDLGTYLMNEKRAEIVKLESNYGLRIIMFPNQAWRVPQYKITPIDLGGIQGSYQLCSETQERKKPIVHSPSLAFETSLSAISGVTSKKEDASRNKPGILKRLLNKWKEATREETVVAEPLVKEVRPEKPKTRNNGALPKHHRTRRSGNRYHHKRLRSSNPNRVNHANNTNDVSQTAMLDPNRANQGKKTFHEKPSAETVDLMDANNVKRIRNRNTRRFGGEPKLKQRGYVKEDAV